MLTMHYKTINSSEGRKNFPRILKEVDENGQIYVVTIHGHAKAAIVDYDLLEEFIENAEYGISQKEILKRAKENTISLAEFKKSLDV